YATNPDRVHNRDTLRPRLERALAAKTAAEWTELLGAAGGPAGPVNTVPEARAHPQVAARGMLVELDHPVAGKLTTLGSPIKLSANPPSIRRPPPTLGQHTDEILAEAGLNEAQITELRENRIVR